MTTTAENHQLYLAKRNLAQINERREELDDFISTKRFNTHISHLARVSYRNMAMLHADLARETERLIQRIESSK